MVTLSERSPLASWKQCSEVSTNGIRSPVGDTRVSETTWAVVVVTIVNMIGSVLMTWIRLYFRAHYNVGEYGRGDVTNNTPTNVKVTKP